MKHTKELTTAGRTSSSVYAIAIDALFIALVLIFTAFVNVRLPIGGNGGLIHLGNIPLFIAAIIFGKKTGCLAGGIGMGLFDIMSGWALWAPFTVVIVGAMGFTVGLITEKKEHQNTLWYTIAIITACVIKVVGYYAAEVILYQNPLAPLGSIPGNLVQVGLAGAVTLVVVGQLRSIAVKMNLID